MWERYCAGLHGICRDGHPDNSDLFCSMWDTLNSECIMVKSMQVTVDNQKQLMSKLVDRGFFAEKDKAEEEESG